jgi:hypothetical protein
MGKRISGIGEHFQNSCSGTKETGTAPLQNRREDENSCSLGRNMHNYWVNKSEVENSCSLGRRGLLL